MTLIRSFTVHPASLLVLCYCLILSGCGGTYDSVVTGVVTLDGSPLPRGTVSFSPDTAGPSAYGLIQSDGKYTVSTGREEGLPSGSYTVTVVANEPSVEQVPGSIPTPGKPISPAWYRTKNTSPLKHSIEPGSNDINLELTSTPPAGWQDPAQRGRR